MTQTGVEPRFMTFFFFNAECLTQPSHCLIARVEFKCAFTTYDYRPKQLLFYLTADCTLKNLYILTGKLYPFPIFLYIITAVFWIFLD